MSDEPNPVGRPTKFRPEMVSQVEKLCRMGATNDDLADFFDVAVSTIHEWRAEHPEFSDALKNGKILADAEVADRLYQRALGYSHPAEKVFCSEGTIVRADIVERYPPDTTAAIFWLKNRQPDKWRDRLPETADGPAEHPIATALRKAAESLEERSG